MKKFIAIALAIVLVLTLGSGVALAAGKASAQRVPLYPVAYGSSDNVLSGQPSQGRVIINDPMGDVALIIKGNVEGLLANHSYTVWVRDMDPGYTGSYIQRHEPLGYYLLDTFTTNGKGRGKFHLNIRADDLAHGTYQIQLAINDPPGGTVLATVKWVTVTVGY